MYIFTCFNLLFFSIDLVAGLYLSTTGADLAPGGWRRSRRNNWSLEQGQQPSTTDGRLRDGMPRIPSTGVTHYDACSRRIKNYNACNRRIENPLLSKRLGGVKGILTPSALSYPSRA